MSDNKLYHSKSNFERIARINKIVDELMEEKINTKPFDFLFRRNSWAYPKTNHIVLGLPGIFKNIENANVYTIRGRNLQPDLIESILPDGEIIMVESAVDVEHQSYLLTPEKIEVMYDSKTFTIAKYEKPCLLYLVTNIDHKTDEILWKVNGEFVSIKIIYISPAKIEKTLNTLSKKDYTKEKLSEVDFLKLVYCLIFTQKEDAKDVIERVADIFVSIKKIESKHQLDLHLVLKTVIKYHFRDENDVRRLLTMITEAMSDAEIEKLSTYEYLVESVSKFEKVLHEKDRIIDEKDMVIDEKNNVIDEKNNVINEKDEKIKELEARIGVLESDS